MSDTDAYQESVANYRLFDRDSESSEKIKLFDFNPNEQEVSSFIAMVLMEVFGENKLSEFENRADTIDSLLKKKKTGIRWNRKGIP